MFSWFRHLRYSPVVPAGNPGSGTRMIATSAERSREPDVDLLVLLADSLSAKGIESSMRNGWLRLADGYLLRPEGVSQQVLDDGRISTTTTLSVCHARHLPEGLFEYQHSAGATTATAVALGFDRWIEVDLKPLGDAIRPGDVDCMTALMDPEKARDLTTTRRRIVFGPPVHFARRPAPDDVEEFCPCCLLTKNLDAFRPQLGTTGFLGIRLYAQRDEAGEIGADCRVNGVDWPPGIEALRTYAASWPQCGFEYRKQYVVIHPADP